MNHHEAVQRSAVEKYALNELSPGEREEFEEHYFECSECAADLRATVAFLDETRKELARQAAAGKSKRQVVSPSKRSRFDFLWRPAFAGPVFALLLLVVIYQNSPLSPRVTGGESGKMDLPEVLPTLSLIGAGSRGEPIPSLTARRGQPLLLLIDVPVTEQYSSYSCALVAPKGTVLWRVSVSPEQAKDTVSIRVPAARWERGDYTVLVQGLSGAPQGKPVEIASYRFTMNTSD